MTTNLDNIEDLVRETIIFYIKNLNDPMYFFNDTEKTVNISDALLRLCESLLILKQIEAYEEED